MNWRKFIFAGFSTFYFYPPSGAEFRYRVIKEEDVYNIYRIGFMASFDRSRSSFEKTPIGQINEHVIIPLSDFYETERFLDMTLRFLFKNRSKFLNRLNIKIHHAGYCARCNRVLKTPEAIQHGIGDECFSEMKINPKERCVNVGYKHNEGNKSSGTRKNKKRGESK